MNKHANQTPCNIYVKMPQTHTLPLLTLVCHNVFPLRVLGNLGYIYIYIYNLKAYPLTSGRSNFHFLHPTYDAIDASKRSYWTRLQEAGVNKAECTTSPAAHRTLPWPWKILSPNNDILFKPSIEVVGKVCSYLRRRLPQSTTIKSKPRCPEIE